MLTYAHPEQEVGAALMKIHKASEDYLEAMLMMQEKHGYIRSIDVAAQLGVTKPSVTYSTKRLRENGYITMDSDSYITLTDKGREIAARIYERHKLLTEFFMHLGVNEDTAREDACRVEHDISEETFDAVCAHARRTRERPSAEPVERAILPRRG